jgi:hypothetical protein
MNERQLKSLFCSSLRSNHIKNNALIPTSEIRVIEEACFRNFDLLIAEIMSIPTPTTCLCEHSCLSTLLAIKNAE